MKYFKIIALVLIFFPGLSFATCFKLSPADKIEDIFYFLLQVKKNKLTKDIDVGLEGNANTVVIRQYYTFHCQWGNVTAVRLSMDSPSDNGPFSFDNIYALDDSLNIVFAKAYSRMNKKWIDPISLNNAVCNRLSNGLKIDSITKKSYIVDFESIQHGPFVLNGVSSVSIKYIRNDSGSLNLIREDVNGEVVIDSIKNHDNVAPSACTVFFMNIGSDMNIISLVSWGRAMDEGIYYKVYGYKYDKNGLIHTNDILDKDHNLSGYDTKENKFKYKDAVTIKKYIDKKYGF